MQCIKTLSFWIAEGGKLNCKHSHLPLVQGGIFIVYEAKICIRYVFHVCLLFHLPYLSYLLIEKAWQFNSLPHLFSGAVFVVSMYNSSTVNNCN